MNLLKRLVLCGIACALGACASHPPVSGTPAEREQIATLALLCADVVDLRRVQQENRNVGEPAAPKWSHFRPQEEGGTWEIVGWLSGSDEMAFMGHLTVFRPPQVLQGVLAREIGNPDRYVVVMRGTRSTIEWLKDGETHLDPTSWGFGILAHRSFYGIYGSLRYQPKGGKTEDGPAWRAILEAVKDKPVMVVGHGIGAPLALFLTMDMAAQRPDVAGRYFGSPRPGNAELVQEAHRRIEDYVVYDNVRDAMPGVPPMVAGASFESAGRRQALEPGNDMLQLGDGVLCQHNAISYAALLQPALMTLEQWQERLALSKQQRKCIVARAS